jgi:asparagine synthase (glutamine-hydrolysing)
VARRGLFSPPAVERLVREHREGREDNAWKIYQLLTLELWARTFLDADGSSPATL